MWQFPLLAPFCPPSKSSLHLLWQRLKLYDRALYQSFLSKIVTLCRSQIRSKTVRKLKTVKLKTAKCIWQFHIASIRFLESVMGHITVEGWLFYNTFFFFWGLHRKSLISAAWDKHHNFGFSSFVFARYRFPPLKWPRNVFLLIFIHHHRLPGNVTTMMISLGTNNVCICGSDDLSHFSVGHFWTLTIRPSLCGGLLLHVHTHQSNDHITTQNLDDVTVF